METAASVTMLELKRRNVLVTVANLLKDSEKNKNLSIMFLFLFLLALNISHVIDMLRIDLGSLLTVNF